MQRQKRAITGVLIVLAVVAGGVVGLRFWASRRPIQVGPVWESIECCAEHQKRLYQSLEHYVEQHGGVPEDVDSWQIRGFPAAEVWKCPETGEGYDVFVENYGDPERVVIADKRDAHRATFMLWFRGYRPRVQTMGDGTIELFEGGKVMTMKGSSKE